MGKLIDLNSYKSQKNIKEEELIVAFDKAFAIKSIIDDAVEILHALDIKEIKIDNKGNLEDIKFGDDDVL